MFRLCRIAFRNLLRYKRRTIMTGLLITVGITAVLLFTAVAGSFKQLMVGQITDSMLGHIQVHQRGYVSSIDNLPLDRVLMPKQAKMVTQWLEKNPRVEAYSERVKFGAMISNYVETTNVRMNGVDPEAETATVPLLPGRLLSKDDDEAFLKRGQVLIPELVSKGMGIKVGDSVALIATNKDGSVNGMQFAVAGVLEGVTGPGGRDGCMHIADARELLRMEEPQVSEIVIRLKQFDTLEQVETNLAATLADKVNTKNKPIFEVHTWERLSPFFNVAGMIDMLMLFVNILLVAIVLISVLNVMVTAVYERIREIGTISAMGTPPGRIMSLFVIEGFLLGVTGAVIGTVLSVIVVAILNAVKLTFDFGRQEDLVLAPTMEPLSVVVTVVLVLVISVLASLQPANKAAKMEPVDALRHV